MNPATHPIYRDTAILSFRLHRQARRARARSLWALVAKLVHSLSLPSLAQFHIARWG